MSQPNVPPGRWIPDRQVPGGPQQPPPPQQPQPQQPQPQQPQPQQASPQQPQPSQSPPPPWPPQYGPAGPAGPPPPHGHPPAGHGPPGRPHPGPLPGAPPLGSGPPRPPRPPRDWGRTWLIALVLALVGVAGAGSGAYALAIATGDSGYGPVGCGAFRCLRGVDGEALLATFKDRGFTCEASETDSDYHQCVLPLGNTEYKADVSTREGMVEDLTVSVNHNPELELSQQSMGFLVWSMVLPFTKDPAAADVSKKWLAQQLAGSGEPKVKIRGYTYSFRSLDQGRFVEVMLEGGYDY